MYKNSKKNEKPKNYSEFNVKLAKTTSNDIENEIFSVLASTKFNKISIPVGSYRRLLDENAEQDDTRSLTVGFIKGYNIEQRVMRVIVFNNFKEIISTFDNPVIEIVFTENNESLGAITKFNIVPDTAITDNK